jgi:hypothetical protein
MRSGYEYQVRDNLRERGIEFGYETEVIAYKSRVRSGCCDECGKCKVSQNRKYTPDFIIPRYDTSPATLYVEAKGRLPSKDRSKMRDVKKQMPELDIRFLFQKRSKKEMNIVAVWAEKNGFPFAFGTEIPDSWL